MSQKVSLKKRSYCYDGQGRTLCTTSYVKASRQVVSVNTVQLKSWSCSLLPEVDTKPLVFLVLPLPVGLLQDDTASVNRPTPVNYAVLSPTINQINQSIFYFMSVHIEVILNNYLPQTLRQYQVLDVSHVNTDQMQIIFYLTVDFADSVFK